MTETDERVSTEAEVEEATAQGWRDDTDHPSYKEAWKFVEDGKNIAPIAAERNKKLERELAKNTDSVNQMRADFFKERKAAQEAGYQRAMDEIKEKQLVAVAEGDTDEYQNLERKKDRIKPPEPAQEQPRQQNEPPDPVFTEWKDKNAQWYGVDTVLTGLADGVGKKIMDDNPMYGIDFYTEVDRQVREIMPGKFSADTRVQTVEGGDRRPRRTGKKDFKSLPKDVKEAFEGSKSLQRIFGDDTKGKELYAKGYHEEYPEG